MTGPFDAVERRLVARLAAVAGMPPVPGGEMVSRARESAGDLLFGIRAVAFLLATRDGVRLPEAIRLRAVGGLVDIVVTRVGDLLEHVGHEEGQSTCHGLLVP